MKQLKETFRFYIGKSVLLKNKLLNCQAAVLRLAREAEVKLFLLLTPSTASALFKIQNSSKIVYKRAIKKKYERYGPIRALLENDRQSEDHRTSLICISARAKISAQLLILIKSVK